MNQYHCFVDDRQGNIWKVPFIDVDWTTKQSGEAGKISFSFMRDSSFVMEVGHVVRFDVDSTPIFYGYIFDVAYDETEKGTATAYDQLIYLKNKTSHVFENETASSITALICKEYDLTVGTIDNTTLPVSFIHQNKEAINAIVDALNRTVSSSNRLYTLYDDAGKINLRSLSNMTTDVVIAYESLATGYKYSRSISDDVYNNVKLIKKDEETSKQEIFIIKDAENIAKWGSLEYSETVDENLNDAEIQARAQLILKLKNRVLRKLEVQSLGNYRARAGAMVCVKFERENIASWFLVSEAQHKFENQNHTMKLSLFMPDVMEEKA